MVGLEQKGIALMKDSIGRFSKPGLLDLELLMGTLYIFETCLLVEKHHGFIQFENDVWFLKN